jgi:hypothetical protein
VSMADTETRASRPDELHRRRVVLVAESAGLAAVVNHLLDPADRLSRLGSLRELAESRSLYTADVVVLDMPEEDRAAALDQVRRIFLGPVVVLVAKGEGTGGLRLDNACSLLVRPFATEELGAALAVPGRPPAPARTEPAAEPTPPPATGPFTAALANAGLTGAGTPGVAVPSTGPADEAKAADPKAAARQAPFRPVPVATPGQLDLIARAQRLLINLTQGWKARRRVRVAGFSVFALIAFTAAFTLAAQGGRCGPGCDAFGTVFSPDPTVAPASSRAASTTGPKNSTTTTAPARGSSGTGVFGGISGSGGREEAVVITTTTTERRVTATTRPATTRPATTRPATTAPPTTAPPTTAPPTTAPSTTAPPTTGGA